MSSNIRAIVDINQTAAEYKSSIVLRISDNKYIDVKSILGLSFTLYQNHEYKLEIHGPDETEAKHAMVEAFKKHHLYVQVNE
ncbi:HPr family phosphocarrier protein [Paenibacillus sp. PL91]|uniref:HPr family phosphocarrier protein n=1 Tax=Paenibacillus sp. PL91 TaxID=2729538 RepID=UPI00145E7FCC|nr:HPr family phosphocarrier protein [Paenibacillus sp. PL91]MBC9203377.1 HPr family phosphocarrier protein [Paenibacillus sp. PL91]